MTERAVLRSPMEVADVVLDEICVEWGFCLHPDVCERIRAIDGLTADTFAEQVVLAELGALDEKWRPLIADRFTHHLRAVSPSEI